MTHVILLNGPPRCGKDTAAGALNDSMQLFSIRGGKSFYPNYLFLTKFAQILKERTHALYGRYDLAHDGLELHKDEPSPLFYGLTPRQAYIAVSETYFKVQHGKQVFGTMLLERIRGVQADIIVISDCGFREEVVPIVEHFEPEGCTLVQLHRNGCTFEKDSRSYLDLSDIGVRTVKVDNNGTKAELERNLLSAL